MTQRFGEARAALGRFVQSLLDRNVLEAAGSIAFRLFLSTIPLLVFVGFVLGQLARYRGINALLDPISEVVPAGAVSLLRAQLTLLARSDAPTLAPLSVAGFLWMTSSGAHNLLNVFAMVFRARRRPWWRQRLHAFGWTLLALALAVGFGWLRVTADVSLHPEASNPIASIVRPAAVQRAQDRAWRRRSPGAARPSRPPTTPETPPRVRRPRIERSLLERGVTFVALVTVGTSVLAWFYRHATDTRRKRRRRVWPGALLAMAVWLFVGWVFGLWVSTLDRYAIYYGSLAAVAVLQLWLFFAALALLLGGFLNAQLEAEGAEAASVDPSRLQDEP